MDINNKNNNFNLSPIKLDNIKDEIIKNLNLVTYAIPGVGRNSFLRVAIGDSFNFFPPIDLGVNSYIKYMTFREKIIKLTFFVPTLNKQDFYNSIDLDGIIIFFDLTKPSTLEQKSFTLAKTLCLEYSKEFPIILIGTKFDLLETLSEDLESQIKKFRVHFNVMGVYKTSAKLNINIEKTLEIIIKNLLKET